VQNNVPSPTQFASIPNTLGSVSFTG